MDLDLKHYLYLERSDSLVLRLDYSRKNGVNTMAADALAPCVTVPSAAMVFKT